MGADLVGYMLKGPRELDRDRFELARGIAANVIGQAGQARAAELAGEDFEREDFDALDNMLIDLDCDLENIAELDPESALSDLVSVWEEGAERDLTTRIDPDDDEQRIVFAGEMSWGDEPEGFAYRTFRDADKLGMLDVFGIR
jgi:hypothetical protein